MLQALNPGKGPGQADDFGVNTPQWYGVWAPFSNQKDLKTGLWHGVENMAEASPSPGAQANSEARGRECLRLYWAIAIHCTSFR